ncbi:transketolase family protein [Bartonella raoultii]|uniref:Transketolase family protein n=1 Tax=Bartonella raoultii TaxID=1457020 RepID=A0ABS7I452_9HYPH|nr:transketolase C-terminal domain-containing protein [Bartonella raoultii]MBX4335020.1 transketolase family protein [Bartonella raoultii]
MSVDHLHQKTQNAVKFLNLDILNKTLIRIAKFDKDIVVLTADSRLSGKIDQFAKLYPERIIEVGIAEQNLVGVAAGLASCGKKPFVVSQACFLTTRALEQIKIDVAYCENPVRLIGISAGISYGPLGATHHAISDFASLRAIPNIHIMAPADNKETEAAILSTLSSPMPAYIRLGKRALTNIHKDAAKIDINKASVVKKGKDILLLATGEAVQICLEAAEELKKYEIIPTVVSVPTIRPLDNASVLEFCKSHRSVIVCEEHSINGGLGDAIARLLMEYAITCRFVSLGIPDEPICNGSQLDILAHYGISREGITKVILAMK